MTKIPTAYEEIPFRELPAEKQNKIYESQFSTALKYAVTEIDGIPAQKWLTLETKKIGMGMFPYDMKRADSGEETICFGSADSILTIEETIEEAIKNEATKEWSHKLDEARKKMKKILSPLPGEDGFMLEYHRGKISIFGSQEFQLSMDLSREAFKHRLRQMILLSRSDSDLEKLNVKKIMIATAFFENEKAFFDVDYALEKYYLKKQKEFDWLCRYIETKIKSQEKHITDTLREHRVFENVRKRLNEEGTVGIGIRGSAILKDPMEEAWEQQSGLR